MKNTLFSIFMTDIVINNAASPRLIKWFALSTYHNFAPTELFYPAFYKAHLCAFADKTKPKPSTPIPNRNS